MRSIAGNAAPEPPAATEDAPAAGASGPAPLGAPAGADAAPRVDRLPVTVVVPTYNRAALLAATLRSVLEQQPPAAEVIVVDDGSPDDTAARVAPLVSAGHVRYLAQANAGLSAARNAGLAAASSDYVLFLDDDDLLLPGALATLVDEAERCPEAAMVAGRCIPFEEEPPPPPPEPASAAAAAATDMELGAFLIWNQLYTAGQVLLRRAALQSAGGFDVRLRAVEDWDMWLRLLGSHRGRWTSVPTLAYRQHGGGMSRNIARMYRFSRRVARRHLASVPSEQRAALRMLSYAQLRSGHADGMARMRRAAAARGDWRRVGEATGMLVLAWASELGARVALKLHLLRRGRWRL